MVQDGRMELDELHIRDLRPGPVGHRDARTARDVRIAGVQIDFARSAARDGGGGREESRDVAGFSIQHIRAETAVRPADVEPGADDQVDRDMVLENFDVRSRPDRLDHGALQLRAGDVPGMQDAALVMAALAPEVVLIGAVGVAEFAAGGEFRAERNDLPDRGGAGFDDRAHRADVGKARRRRPECPAHARRRSPAHPSRTRRRPARGGCCTRRYPVS